MDNILSTVFKILGVVIAVILVVAFWKASPILAILVGVLLIGIIGLNTYINRTKNKQYK